MGCCTSTAEVDEHLPLLSPEEQQKVLSTTPVIRSVQKSDTPALSTENKKVIGAMACKLVTVNPTQMEHEAQTLSESMSSVDVLKEMKKKLKANHTKEIMALPKPVASSSTANEFDMKFLNDVLSSNLAKIADEYAKDHITTTSNFVVEPSSLQNPPLL